MSSMLAILISPLGLRAGQGYLCSNSGRVCAAADCELDEGGADRAAVIGLAIIADGAQIGEVVVAHEVLIGAGEIGVDHAHGDGEWIRLYHVVGVLEVHGMPAVEQLRGEWRNRDCSVDRSVVEG